MPQSLLYLMKTLTENLELNLTFSSWLNRKKNKHRELLLVSLGISPGVDYTDRIGQ